MLSDLVVTCLIDWLCLVINFERTPDTVYFQTPTCLENKQIKFQGSCMYDRISKACAQRLFLVGRSVSQGWKVVTRDGLASPRKGAVSLLSSFTLKKAKSGKP